MNDRLNDLLITSDELGRLTGLENINRADSVREKSRLPAGSETVIRPTQILQLRNASEDVLKQFLRIHHYPKLVLWAVILVLWSFLSRFIVGIPVGLLLGGLLFLFFGIAGIRNYVKIRNLTREYLDNLKPTSIGILLDEVDNYNDVVGKIISHVRVMDRLKEIGHPVNVKDINPIIDVFRDIRSDLVRALKTEKVFRDNPKVKLEDFSLDFMPYRALELDEQAKECEALVNQALEIGGRVQLKMKDLLTDLEASKNDDPGLLPKK